MTGRLTWKFESVEEETQSAILQKFSNNDCKLKKKYYKKEKK